MPDSITNPAADRVERTAGRDRAYARAALSAAHPVVLRPRLGRKFSSRQPRICRSQGTMERHRIVSPLRPELRVHLWLPAADADVPSANSSIPHLGRGLSPALHRRPEWICGSLPQ